MTLAVDGRGHLEHEVISCSDAAAAKGIPLGRELKTLILTAGGRLLVASLPGDRRLHLRSVKRVAATRQACLCSVEELASMGLAPGSISPFLPQLARVHHLIDPACFALDWMSTNDGTRRGFIVFDPRSLHELDQITVAEIGVPT